MSTGKDNEIRIVDSLLIVLDGKLQVARDDTRFLIVASGVTSEFEDLSGEVFENGGKIN